MFDFLIEVGLLYLCGLLLGIVSSRLFWKPRINKLEARILDLDTSIIAKDNEVKGLKKNIQNHKRKLDSLNTDLQKKISDIEGLNNHIQHKDTSITKSSRTGRGM